MTIQRCGVNVISVNDSTREAKSQFQLLKSIHKKDYSNFIVTFETIFSNCNV